MNSYTRQIRASVGGLLTQDLDWRWRLYVNLIIAAVAGAGAVMLPRPQPAGERPRLDTTGLSDGG